MRTGRSLTVCCSLLPGGCVSLQGGSAWSQGGGLPDPGGLPAGGSAWSRGGGGSAWSGGLPAGGVCLVPGRSAWGGSPCWWGVCLVQGGVCLVPGGSAWSGGVSAWSQGYLPGLGGCLPGPGGSLETPPPVDRITDTCKNITLATTSLRPVKIWSQQTASIICLILFLIENNYANLSRFWVWNPFCRISEVTRPPSAAQFWPNVCAQVCFDNNRTKLKTSLNFGSSILEKDSWRCR